MRPEELCIGNWVRRRWTCTDTGREVVRDFQITEIRKNGETLYAWGKNGNMGRVEQLEPIPLTQEILEKNGFESTSAPSERVWKRNGQEVWLDNEGKKYWANIKNGEFYFEGYIEHAHELQHALRLCGIEKTIEL